MAAKGKSRVASKPKRARKVATKKVAKVKPAEPVVRNITPVLTSAIPYTAPVITQPQVYKEVKAPASRTKMWVAVTVCSIAIACIWAFNLSNTLFNSSAIDESISDTGIEEFVNSISTKWDDLQQKSQELPVITTNANTTTEQAPASAANNTNSLDNLFSDL